MIVNPFWFGVGVGVVGTIIFEVIALIVFSVCISKKEGK